jgi:hypothetical protein
MANPEFTGIDWIGPAAAGHGSFTHRYIVWHCTDNASSTARGEANFAHTRTDGIGTHFVADEGSCIQTLETWKAVGHVGSTVGNERGIALEMCGTESSSTAHYRAVIDRAMPAIRAACGKWGIPARWLSSSQANDGVSKGWLTHDDARRYWGKTTHTDPGPNFPRQYAIDAFNGFQGANMADWTQQQINDTVFTLVGNSGGPVHARLSKLADSLSVVAADVSALKSKPAADAAAVAAALAADQTFVTAIANAVGAAVKDQFGAAFDQRLVDAANRAEDS